MSQCPQCNKTLASLVRKCPTCQADLDLLVDFVSHLQGGVERADSYARSGDLGRAVWAYLEVLETDPDNTPARRQIAQVVTAVRQFDLSNPQRRLAAGLPPEQTPAAFWRDLTFRLILGVLLLGGVFAMGFLAGSTSHRPVADSKQLDPIQPDNAIGPPPKPQPPPPQDALGPQ